MAGFQAIPHQLDTLNLNMNNQFLFQLSQGQSRFQYQPITLKRPVGIFWDLENCSIPRGLNTYSLVNQIRLLLEQFALNESEFAVVCDVYGITNNVINELNDMQVNIIHVSSYSKNASDEKLKQLIYRFIMIHGQNCAIILLSSKC